MAPSSRSYRIVAALAVGLSMHSLVPAVALAEASFPAYPGADQPLLDTAGFLGEGGAPVAAKAATALASDGHLVHIAMLQGLAHVGAAGWGLRDYARGVFEHWAGQGLPRDRSLLVVISVDEKGLVVVPGSSYLADARRLRDVEAVFAHHLDAGDRPLALQRGVEALAAFGAGEAIGLPGSRLTLTVWIVLFVLVGLGIVDYLRAGPTCVSYRVLRAGLSVVSAGITWALTRSVDLGANLASSDGGQEDSTGVLLGRW